MESEHRQERARRIIWIYLGLVSGIALAMAIPLPLYVVFLQARGLPLTQVLYLKLVAMVTAFLTQVPTGAYADVFGRKRAFVLSCLLIALGYLLFYISASLPYFVLAEMVVALGVTFGSGATDAWLVDSLRHISFPEEKVDGVFGKSGMFVAASQMIGGVIGGYLGELSIGLPWLMGGVSVGVPLVASLFIMQEAMPPRGNISLKGGLHQLGQTSKLGVTIAIRNMSILLLILGNVLFSLFTMTTNMFWQPYFKSLGLSTLGWIFFFINGTTVVGNWLAQPVSLKLGRVRAITMMLLLTTVIIYTTVFAPLELALTLVLFIGHYIPRTAFKPIRQALLNQYISKDISKERATVLSFDGMLSMVGYAIGLLSLGGLAEISIPLTWIVGATALVLSVPLYVRAGRHTTSLIPPASSTEEEVPLL